MNKKTKTNLAQIWRIAVPVSIGLVAMAVGVLAVLAVRKDVAYGQQVDSVLPLLVSVRAAEASMGYNVRTSFTGMVEGGREGAVGFEIGGMVSSVRFDEGDQLEAGSVIASLDTQRFEASRAELAAAVFTRLRP